MIGKSPMSNRSSYLMYIIASSYVMHVSSIKWSKAHISICDRKVSCIIFRSSDLMFIIAWWCNMHVSSSIKWSINLALVYIKLSKLWIKHRCLLALAYCQPAIVIINHPSLLWHAMGESDDNDANYSKKKDINHWMEYKYALCFVHF